VALGASSASAGDNAVALGASASAAGANAIALGLNASATGADGLAFGRDTQSSGAGAIAFGAGVKALQEGAIGIGRNAGGAGGAEARSIVIGDGAGDGAGTESVSIGYLSDTVGKAVAIGPSAHAFEASGVALGDSSQVSAGSTDSVAIGHNASVAIAGGGGNAVALGANSVADAADTVSLGNGNGLRRRIVHVQDGIQDDDAATVGQLNTTFQPLANLPTDVADLQQNALLHDGNTYNAARNGLAQRITGVADPQDGTDAANMRYVEAKIQDITQDYGDALVYTQGKDFHGTTMRLFDASRSVGGNATKVARKIVGVADGIVEKNSTEVVTGNQLWETNKDITVLAGKFDNSLAYDATAVALPFRPTTRTPTASRRRRG
jgi:hypothetical protein